MGLRRRKRWPNSTLPNYGVFYSVIVVGENLAHTGQGRLAQIFGLARRHRYPRSTPGQDEGHRVDRGRKQYSLTTNEYGNFWHQYTCPGTLLNEDVGQDENMPRSLSTQPASGRTRCGATRSRATTDPGRLDSARTGGTFWFNRNRLDRSYSFLTATSRS